MTHTLRLTALTALVACTGGSGGDPTSDPTGSTPSTGSPLTSTDDGTQFGGEGTESTPSCTPEEGLPASTPLDDSGATAAEVMASIGDLPPGFLAWFDGRPVDVTVSIALDEASLRLDSGCNHLVDADLQVASADGAVVASHTVSFDLQRGYAKAWFDIDDADWQGALSHEDVLGESCVEGAVWTVSQYFDDGLPTGSVSVRCNPWSGGGGAAPGDDTAGLDTGRTDATDSTSVGTATGTATTGTVTTDTETGGGGDEPSDDPQHGYRVDVVLW